MARDVLADFDGPALAPLPVPAPGAPKAAAPATSAIVQERAGTGRSPWLFLALALSLAALAGVAALALGLAGAETPAEDAAQPLVWGLSEDLAAGRAASAVATGATVLAVASLGRSLTRSDVAGLLAGALVAADPSILLYGRLALPTALTVAALAGSFALMALPGTAPAWGGAALLAFAAFVDPRSLLWGPPLAAFLLLRGHIYASPRHLAFALAQALAIPAVGALLHLAADRMWASVPVCLAPPRWALLDLQAAIQAGPSLAAVPNPITWLAGLGALLFLGVGALVFGGARFRLARANGRLQARLVAPFPAVLGRGAWLLLFAAMVPIPQAWILLFALALALGVQHLGEDAPGFGLTLAMVLLLFAGLVLWRSWDAVAGTGGAAGVASALDLVPWSRPVLC